MTYFPSTKIKAFEKSAQIDAFNALRVSMPAHQFGSKLLVDSQPLFWDDAQTAGGGTSSAHSGSASVKLSTTGSTAGTRVRQSKLRGLYQPGKSHRIKVTFNFTSTGESGVTRRVGYFDADNGIFFEETDGTLYFVMRNGGVDTKIEQSHMTTPWNIDEFDGNGPSGKTLDISKSQIFFIEMQYLAVGSVWVGFEIDGEAYYGHRFDHSNVETGVYMENPNLPIRYEIDVTAAPSGAHELECICSEISSEGGVDDIGFGRSLDRGTTSIQIAGTGSLFPICALRLNSSYLMARVKAEGVHVYADDSSVYRWALLLNPSVTGTALSFTQEDNSPADGARGPTNSTTVSGGTELASGYGSSTQQVRQAIKVAAGDLRLGSKIDGTSDVLVLAVELISGTNVDFYGGMSWREIV